MAKRRLVEPNINNIGIDNDGQYPQSPEVSETLQDTLGRTFGWDYANSNWKPAIIDTDGRLLVSTSPTKASSSVASSASPTTTSAVILSANADRKEAIIQNIGGVAVYISFGGTANITNSFLLIPDATLIVDVWLGAMAAITASGTGSLIIQEMS